MSSRRIHPVHDQRVNFELFSDGSALLRVPGTASVIFDKHEVKYLVDTILEGDRRKTPRDRRSS